MPSHLCSPSQRVRAQTDEHGRGVPDPDPLTEGYDTAFDPQCTGDDGSGDCFGKTFMDKYCIQCHDKHAAAVQAQRRAAAPRLRLRSRACWRCPTTSTSRPASAPRRQPLHAGPQRCPSVPGGSLDIDCPQPTDDERTQMSVWIACARDRKYNFRPDAGVVDDGNPGD